MKLRKFLMVLGLGFLLACGGSGGAPQTEGNAESAPEKSSEPVKEPGPQPLAVFLVTGQTEGRLEPCGCSKNPAGGLSRREGIASALKEEFPDSPVVFLETGSFLSYRNPAAHVFNATLVDWMGHAGYVATGVGDTDLIQGLDHFHEQIADLGIHYLSANIEKDGEQVFPGSTTFVLPANDGGEAVHVGLIGLSGPVHSPKFEMHESLSFGDPALAAQEEYNTLTQPADGSPAPDLVFLLGTLHPDDARPVVQAVPNADMYAFSADMVVTQQIQKAGLKGSPLFYTGDLGRRMFEFLLFRDGEGYRWAYRNLYLGEGVPESPHWDQRVQATIAEANEVNKRLLTGHKVEKKPGDRAYFKGGDCASCHPQAVKVWQESRHAGAMKTLVIKNQDYNPECLPCHTTGMGQWDGFVTPEETPHRINVQCESCHGPRDGHPVFERELRAAKKQVPVDPATRGEELCRSCHTEADSPEFTFEAYWPKIAHGRE